MKKLGAQIVFATFLVMLSTAVITVTVILLLQFLGALPQVKYPAIVWPVIALAICVAVGTGINALLTRWYFRPMKQLIEATRRVAKGDFTVRVEEINGVRNELEELTKSFNVMAEELGSTELFRRDFINSFSHEFRTPMVSIRGFARQLKKSDITEEQRGEYADIIINEADRLTNMASNILTLTRVENQQIITDRQTFRLDEQLRSCVLLLQKEWEAKDISLDINLEETEYTSNEEMLSQVWLNILSNAIKFSKSGGEIRIYCESSPEGVRVEIEDHGIGMNEETRRHAFERFYQGAGSRATAGSGLGLSIAKRIVELNGGEINLESELNRGTLFIVTLPVQQA